MFSESHIYRLYDQGAERVFRLVRQLECRIEEMEALLTRAPQPVINLLSKELAKTNYSLARQTQELIEQRQLNNQLLCRIRELEAALEGGAEPVVRDSHNSSSPPSADPPWQKVRRTRSLRQKSGMKAGGQFGHRGATLRQVALPDQLIIHAPQSCATCRVSLEPAALIATIRRQVFDLAEGRMHIVEHQARATPLFVVPRLDDSRLPHDRARSRPVWDRRSFTRRISQPLSTSARRQNL